MGFISDILMMNLINVVSVVRLSHRQSIDVEIVRSVSHRYRDHIGFQRLSYKTKTEFVLTEQLEDTIYFNTYHF